MQEEIRLLKEQVLEERQARIKAEALLSFHLQSLAEPLETSTHRLAVTISNLQEGILLEDENRHIVLVNAAFCNMFGIEASPAHLIGADCTGSAEQVKLLFKNPDQFTRRIARIIEDRQLVSGDVLELCNGRVYQRDFIPIFINEAYFGHLWKYLDITERHHAENTLRIREEKYRSIIANMNLGLLEVDNNDCIQFANQSFCLMSGYELAEIKGKKAADIFLLEPSFMEEKKRLRAQGQSDAYEVTVRNKQGELKGWMISGAPRFDEQGKLEGSIGIHLDITQRKKLEEQLREAKLAAEESSKVKEIFLANMSHEIRTPMNAILGMSRLLSKTALGDQQDSYLKAIISSAENLLVIINDILDISKIDAGKMSIEKISFDLVDLMAQLNKMMYYKAEEKGLSFTTGIEPEIPRVLSGDPYRINQVLLNLASNAIKFTEKGQVSVLCKRADPGRRTNKIEFTVTDTGIGIEEHFLENIFDYFSQEDAATTRKFGGTGLGLGISRKLVWLMGGALEIKSERGRGTSVSFILDLPAGNAVEVEQKTTPTILQNQLEGVSVLLVEDNEMNRVLATTVLENYGARVTEADNGQVAIEKMEESAFDLVLMDLQMPVMNGLEATHYIRERISKTIPIIALTANAIKGESNRCLEAGMNNFLSKPFEETILIAMIDSYVHGTGGKTSGFGAQTSNEALLPPATDYSLQMLEQVAKGDKRVLNRMLSTFVSTIELALPAICEAFRRQDVSTIRRLSHKIKPSIDSLQVAGAKNEIRLLEAWPDEKGCGPEMEALIEQTKAVLRRVTADVKAMLPLNLP